MSRYNGKYLSAGVMRRLSPGAVILILLAILGLTIGSVVAYLSTHTDAVENKFLNDEPTKPVVLEDAFSGTVKNNVKVDIGDPGYAVYVRAAVVVTWKDKDGNVMGVSPVAGTDYSITYNTDDWVLGADGFYYHKKAVNTGDDTEVLISTCSPVDGKTPGGYGLNVEIIAQTIQALGTTDSGDVPAVVDAWGITVVNGEIQ